jgi:hypothetical protein
MAKYKLKAEIPATLHRPGGAHESVVLPMGAVIEEASRHSSTIAGKIGVYCDGRHYSISMRDLLTKAEVIGR